MNSINKILPLLFELDDLMTSYHTFSEFSMILDISDYKLDVATMERNDYTSLGALFPDKEIVSIEYESEISYKQQLFSFLASAEATPKVIHFDIDGHTYDYSEVYMKRQIDDIIYSYTVAPTFTISNGGITDYVYTTPSGDLVIIHSLLCNQCCRGRGATPFQKIVN